MFRGQDSSGVVEPRNTRNTRKKPCDRRVIPADSFSVFHLWNPWNPWFENRLLEPRMNTDEHGWSGSWERKGSLGTCPVFVCFRVFRGQDFSGVVEPRNARNTRKKSCDRRVIPADSFSVFHLWNPWNPWFENRLLEPRISRMNTDRADLGGERGVSAPAPFSCVFVCFVGRTFQGLLNHEIHERHLNGRGPTPFPSLSPSVFPVSSVVKTTQSHPTNPARPNRRG